MVRQHRRSLVDRALGQVVPTPSSSVSATAAADTSAAAIPSPLVSSDGFRVVMTRFEKLSRSAPPKGVSDLVYGDAYMTALSLSRRREVRTVLCSVPFDSDSSRVVPDIAEGLVSLCSRSRMWFFRRTIHMLWLHGFSGRWGFS